MRGCPAFTTQGTADTEMEPVPAQIWELSGNVGFAGDTGVLIAAVRTKTARLESCQGLTLAV
eukprot:SAG11_NODE_11859_length_734_cov_1.516535_1_plen_61_part_10